MIKFLGQLPKKCTVAFSGGLDSVVATDFLLRGRREVELAFFHHGTPASDDAQRFVEHFAGDRGLKLTAGHISQFPTTKDRRSPEELWRDCRYAFLSSLEGPVVAAHHLDDAVETWLFSAMHGAPKLIPYRRGNVIRPFLVTPKAQLRAWATTHDLSWAEDESNRDTRYMRNLIRHDIVPHALRVNPGLHSVIRKKYLAEEMCRGA